MAAKPWITPTKPPPAGRKAAPVVLRRNHPVATAFLDESGIISADRFFSIGLVKSPEPSRLLRSIQRLRDTHHWYGEIKWYDVTLGTLELYKEVVDTCLVPGNLEFWCFVADRQAADPIVRFGSQWDAYAKLAEQLVVAALHPDELIAIMADNYSTPAHILFEEDLRAAVNRRLNRLAAVSVVRLDSRSSDGLQVADLLTSAITFEFRQDAGLASSTSPKAKLAKHVRTALGARSCLGGWRNAKHSVALYGVNPPDQGVWPPRFAIPPLPAIMDESGVGRWPLARGFGRPGFLWGPGSSALRRRYPASAYVPPS